MAEETKECPDAIFGCHIKKEPTLLLSLKRVKSIIDMVGFKAIQIYLANPQAYRINMKKYNNPSVMNKYRKDLIVTKKYAEENGIAIFIHACLYYNLCGAPRLEKDKDYIRKKNNTIGSLSEELDIALALNAEIVVHSGSCVNKSRRYEEFHKNLLISFERKSRFTEMTADILGISEEEVIKKRKVLFENSSGQGTMLGATIQELSDILNTAPESIKDRIGFCIDSAHIHGAGAYNLSTIENVDKMLKDIKQLIGTERVKLIHLNDSKAKLGSKLDRHECLGKGTIWKDHLDVLKYLIRKLSDLKIPMIGEPPENNDAELLKDLGLV